MVMIARVVMMIVVNGGDEIPPYYAEICPC